MASRKRTSRDETILEKNTNTNLGSRKLKTQYSLGKTNFLDAQQSSTIKKFQSVAHQNKIYNAVVLRVEEGEIPDILGVANPGSSNQFVVRAAIPELHTMFPDPFKYGGHNSIIDMYPTFSGHLEQVPLVGSNITVSFIDENNKFKTFGNGKILGLIQNPVDGSALGQKAQTYNNSVMTAVGQMMIDQAACKFLELAGSAPKDEKPILKNKENVGENHPQTVNSAYQSRDNNVERTTAPTSDLPGTSGQTPTEQEEDTSSTTNIPDCKKVTNLREYIDSTLSDMGADSQDPNAEFPAWPLVYGSFDVKTKKAIKPARLTSGLQPKRTITVRKNGKTITKTRSHRGQDIAAPQSTPTLATLEGEVVSAVPNGGIPTSTKLSYIIIRHDGYGGKGDRAIHSCYFHMSNVLVKKGDIVKRGACIGLSGGAKDSPGSGGTTGPHLHFEIRKRRRVGSLAGIIDPVTFLSTKWKKTE
tara:strand:+ start:14355 stop:15770 length:1416 start_codon:yes stop_codon:yes gene_type:complete